MRSDVIVPTFLAVNVVTFIELVWPGGCNNIDKRSIQGVRCDFMDQQVPLARCPCFALGLSPTLCSPRPFLLRNECLGTVTNRAFTSSPA